MTDQQTTQPNTRIALDDVITAAGQGAMRALSARQQAATETSGFYVVVNIRVGIPAVLRTVNPVVGGEVGGGGVAAQG